jgi:hypothetical protein
MNKHHRRLLLPLSLLLATAAPLLARPRTVDPVPNPNRDLDRRIDDAIKRGVDYLLEQKKKSRDHLESPTQNLQLIWALLQLGHSVEDPRLRANSPELAASVQWLLAEPTDTAIDTSFKALAIAQMPVTPELKLTATQTRDALLKLIRTDGSVSAKPGANTLNTSEIRWVYAALAALEDFGVEIDPVVWKTAEQWWRGNQLKDGGWPDIRVLPNSNPNATAAGVAGLYLASARNHPPHPAPRPEEPLRDTHLDAGVKKLIADFSPRSQNYIYLYTFERAASAAGIADIHDLDWYKTIAAEILKNQRDNGAWVQAEQPAFAGDPDVYATACALLTLARGRDPVVFSKLEYAGRWNDYPCDDANLTHWLSHELDKPLNWQIVTLDDPPAQLGAAPILLITGAGDPNFSADDIAKLRAFVQAGGLIFSSANNADPAFTTAIVKKYAPELSEKHYEMRALPQSHELFAPELYSRIAPPPPLLGMSNGVREWWIHSPTDMAVSWQTQKTSARDHFLFPANLLRYATGNESLPNKLQTPPAPPATPVETARTIHLARLDYGGNCDPEPAAWPRLAAFAPPRFHTLLQIATVKIPDLDFAKTPVAHMTGTGPFTLTPAEIASLKKFLDAGGTLLADSAGADPKFTASFQNLMTTLYPDNPPAELPINDPVFNGSIPDSVKITDVDFRKYALAKMKDRQPKPKILAVTLHARHVILFSPEDITTGLLGTETWAIRGYTPQYATQLARNLLLYTTSK